MGYSENTVAAVRAEIAKDKREAEKAKVRTMIVEYGDDTYAKGTVFKAVSVGKKNTGFLVTVKVEDGKWYRTGYAYPLTWDEMVDEFIGIGVAFADVEVLTRGEAEPETAQAVAEVKTEIVDFTA